MTGDRHASVIPRTQQAPAEPAGVGVWESVSRSGEFRRSLAREHEWRFWADVEQIPPKRGPRVVLLGESAARGYFYDPALTPAAILQALLGGIEVIDLARVDLTPGVLVALLDALPALDADAIVLFVGNNWRNVLASVEKPRKLADAVRSGAWTRCREIVLQDIVIPHCRSMLDRLAEKAGPLPVVVVVPEFNLADWRCERAVLVPVLAEGRNVRWMEARGAAEEALAGGHFKRAFDQACVMTELDAGASSLGQELLGRMHLAQGRLTEARLAFEAARDAVFGMLIAHAPRCPAAAQQALRAGAIAHGFEIVDLPRLFEAEMDGALPDRRLFLDYCHLTVRGLVVAMSAVAQKLATRLGAPSPLPQPHLAPEDEAAAHVLAALHNAHHGQPGEILRYHLTKAVELSPRSARELIESYMRVQAHPGALWMSASFDRLCGSRVVKRYLGSDGSATIDGLADIELAAVIDEIVGSDNHDSQCSEGTADIDLLAPRHHASTFRERGGVVLQPLPAYYQAMDLSSFFSFSCKPTLALRARLCLRLPGAITGSANVRIFANTTLLECLPASGKWRTFEIDLPAHILTEGRNSLRIAWPLIEPRGTALLERAARCLERGAFPQVLPAYGEIHSFTIGAADTRYLRS